MLAWKCLEGRGAILCLWNLDISRLIDMLSVFFFSVSGEGRYDEMSGLDFFTTLFSRRETD